MTGLVQCGPSCLAQTSLREEAGVDHGGMRAAREAK